MQPLMLAVALAFSASGTVPAVARPLPAGAKVVRADPNAPQSVRLGLVLQDRAGLEALIAEQHDPRSPRFRHWLTPDELGARFGVGAASYERLVKAFASAGFEVRRSKTRLFLEAEGRVASVERLFGIELVEVSAGGTHFRSFRGTPHLRGAEGAWIQSVSGLDTRIQVHPRLSASGQNTFGPQDLRRYYDIDALHAAGFGGQLSRVVALGDIPDTANYPSADDITWFYRNVSDSPAAITIDDLGLGSSSADTQPGVKIEEEMDAELSSVAAPLEREVVLVLAPGDSLFTAGMNEIVNNLSDVTAVSISFGSCELLEAQYASGEMQTTRDLVEQGVAEGIAWFSASGDDGVVTCYRQAGGAIGSTPSVDFPSALPYMTAVGGTMYTADFDANAAISGYGAETTWNEFGQAAGGGGVSTVYARPWWQTAPGTSDGGFREVPDFALLSATQPGVAIVATRPGQIDPFGNGTSDAAPLAAGIFALVNDRIGGCRLGSPSAQLYALAAAQYGGNGPAVFHDITTGDISVDGVTGPAAHVGYDEATGLGSLDVAALAAAWPPCVAPAVVDGGAPDAGYLVWPGGESQDAGPRPAFDACSAIACDGGAICSIVPEGPAQCRIGCDPSQPNSCGAGNYCEVSSGTCQPGCQLDADCTGGDVCLACANLCVTPGNPSATVGSACRNNGDCQTGGGCIPENYGFAGGYCSSDCSAGCGCPSGSACLGGYCFLDCSVSAQSGCRTGYVCDPVDATDTGACLPDCRDLGNQCFGQGQSCDPATGICVTAAGGSSGSTGSTGSSGASSGSGTGSSGSTGVEPTTGSSGTGSGTTTGSGSTTGAGGTTGSKDAQHGCGCGNTGGLEAGWSLVLAAGAWLGRRRASRRR